MVNLEPDLAEPHFALGSELEFLGQFGEAETELRKSLRLQDSSKAEHELGTILLDLRRNREAVICLLRALKIGPETPELLMNLGLAYSREGHVREANLSFQRGLELGGMVLNRIRGKAASAPAWRTWQPGLATRNVRPRKLIRPCEYRPKIPKPSPWRSWCTNYSAAGNRFSSFSKAGRRPGFCLAGILS